jgi:hypothetical protein
MAGRARNAWGALKRWAAERKRALFGKVASMITTGRVLAFVYAVAMLGVAYFFLPWHRDESHVQAVRYLGANTRMARTLWTQPREQAGRLELARLEDDLVGKYLRRPVEADKPLSRADVMPWPDLPDEEIVQILLDEEPNWLMLNQGSTVDVWIGQKRATTQYAVVQAIVASGTRWVALLRRKDFAADTLGNTADKPTLHLVKLPHKPLKP